MRLLYTYRDLNAVELDEIPATDLYVHRVRLRSGTKPYSVSRQRRWPPGKEFWLNKVVQDGLACGMYKRTVHANGRLSDWNAQAMLVDKSDNPGPYDEPRVTFNYRNVTEDMPGSHLELTSKVHDYLSCPGLPRRGRQWQCRAVH